MINKIELVKSAQKAFLELYEPDKSRIRDRINEIKTLGLGAPNIKALSGNLKGLYRIRSGDYRIIFTYDNDLFTITAILHRKNAYD